MAKELMEIGGFITEGAEIVNHDNTLSGNGTVDSPLGVVPGYNETVLFEGTTAAKVPQSSITLSESANNFEKIDILYRDRYQNIFDSKTIYTSNMTFDNENTSRVLLSAPFLYNSTTPQYIRATQYKFSNNTTMTFETNNLTQITTSGIKCNFSTTPDNNGCYVWKVIGINRINNA